MESKACEGCLSLFRKHGGSERAVDLDVIILIIKVSNY